MGLFNKKKADFIPVKAEKRIDWNEPNGEGCIVSDRITKDGFKVGYMYREQPAKGRPDSGWRFMAGNEDDAYMSDPNHHHVFALNTVCGYDSDIIPYLRAKTGSAYRQNNRGTVVFSAKQRPYRLCCPLLRIRQYSSVGTPRR